MPPVAIDLTLSDEEEEVVHTGGTTAAARVPNQQAILAAALARAGSANYSGVAQNMMPRPTLQSQQMADYAAARRQFMHGMGGLAPQQQQQQQQPYHPMYWSPITLSVASATTFKVSCETQLPPAAIRVMKQIPGAVQNESLGTWELPLGQHVNFYMAMQRERVICERIPQRVLCQLATATATDGDASGENDRMDEHGYARCDDEDDDNAISDIPRKVWDALAPFQRQGVSWIVKRNGRALLADEPGLGKTIQAIASASAYYHEWPLLIVSPSSARYHWEQELRHWLPEEDGYLPHDAILVITSEKMASKAHVDGAKVVVTSYDLVHREQVKNALRDLQPKVVICDECHYLKNGKAQRTKSLTPFIQQARRAILLSGTPALSRPIEVFWQLHALDKDQWPNPTEFHRRYCTGKKKAAAGGGGGSAKDEAALDKDDPAFSGASNLEELHTLLRATLMLRRNKADILKTLPPKVRIQVEMTIEDPEVRAELAAELKEFRSRASLLAELSKGNKTRRKKRLRDEFLAAGEDDDDEDDEAKARRKAMAMEKKALLMQLFRRSGFAKLAGISRHVREVLDSPTSAGTGKILIFAHHRALLDALSAGVLKDVPHIRIDGNTPAKERMTRVNRFQDDDTIRVALLGITAAGVALTLTAATRVMFTELYWTPAALIQAEDRAHRIGQTSEVVVEYLLAPNCVDDILWPCIQHKMLMLGELFENKKNTQMEAEDGSSKADAANANDDDDTEELVEIEELEELEFEDPEALKRPRPTGDEDVDDDNPDGGRFTPTPAPADTLKPAPAAATTTTTAPRAAPASTVTQAPSSSSFSSQPTVFARTMGAAAAAVKPAPPPPTLVQQQYLQPPVLAGYAAAESSIADFFSGGTDF